jgi:hypothetical protein
MTSRSGRSRVPAFELATSLGAKSLTEPIVLPDIQTFVTLMDPQGVALSILQGPNC